MLACIFKLFGLACTLVFSCLFFEQKGYAENYLKKSLPLPQFPLLSRIYRLFLQRNG